MRLALLGFAACAVLVAGCSKPAANTASNSASVTNTTTTTTTATASAGAPAAPGAVSGTPGEMPSPAAGEWKRVSVQDGGAPDTSTKCLDGKPIDPMEGGGPKCASLAIVRGPDGSFVVDADCPANGIDAKLHMSGSGDYKTSFTTDATMSIGDQGHPPTVMRNQSTWTYVGPTCSS